MAAEHYKIVKGTGAGGFMSPPGDPAHLYSIESYSSNRSNARLTGSYSIESDAEWIPQHIRDRARKILESATRTPSELWIRNVYGYFRNMWTADGRAWSTTDAIKSGRPEGAPIEWHAAVVHVRRHFPDHEPRAELIDDPGNGYGAYPCDKCGQRVQYEAHLDALAVVSTRMSGSGITQWSYVADCPEGGAHVVTD
jgi:hypothetical protein